MAQLKKGISNIRQSVSNVHWVEQLINGFLDGRDEEIRVGREFHPSAAGQCPRLIQFSMLGMITRKFEPRVKRIFDAGHDMHNRYKRYFERMGKLVAEEAPVRATIEGIKITGRADLIVKNFMDENRLLELKTANTRRFEEILVKNLCNEDHFTQWNIYSGVLKIPIGEILYENKDNQHMKVFTVRFDQEKFDKVIGMFKVIDYHLSNGTLVPKPDVCDSKYCPAKELCKKTSVEAKKTKVDLILGKKRSRKDG